MAVAKDPDVKTLYTRTIKRYNVANNPQLNLGGVPTVDTITTTIVAYYCAPLSIARLIVSGSSHDGWQYPIALDTNDDWHAIQACEMETYLIERSLPYVSTPEDAIAEYKARMMSRGQTHTDPDAPPADADPDPDAPPEE